MISSTRYLVKYHDQPHLRAGWLALGRVRWARGERSQAAADWRRGLALARDLGLVQDTLDGLEDLVWSSVGHDPPRAARLLGAAAAQRAARRLPRALADEAAYAALVAAVRTRLGAAFTTEVVAGEALAEETAVATALAVAEEDG